MLDRWQLWFTDVLTDIYLSCLICWWSRFKHYAGKINFISPYGKSISAEGGQGLHESILRDLSLHPPPENHILSICDRQDAKKKIKPTTSSDCNKAFEWLGTQRLKPNGVVSLWHWAEVYSQRAERGRKREDTVDLFSEWRVLEVRAGFHTETMARVHPAALSLLLSLPILRLCICLWAETHGTSCSAQHASQEFTSCSSALLSSHQPYSQDMH